MPIRHSATISTCIAATCVASAAAGAITVTVQLTSPVHTVAHPYVGVNVDTGSAYNGFDFTDPILTRLLEQLGPRGTVLRIGGTAADYAWYLPDDTREGDGDAHTIWSNARFDSVMALVKATGVQLLWNFNGLFRTGGAWDPTANATAFLQYVNSKYAGTNIWWSVSNEPDLWPNTKPNGAALARDALRLKALLGNYNVGKTVYGPAYSGFNGDSASFMSTSKGGIDGYTCHNYPLARRCTLDAYLDRAPITTSLGNAIAAMARVKAANADPGLTLMLEEIGGSYGGGCENITDRFASGFWYLNSLAVVGERGFDRYSRQDLAGWSFTGGQSHYQLAGPPGWTKGSAAMTPHPDWFTTVLWNQLVGQRALLVTNVAGDAPSVANVSVHVWCASNRTAGPGAATLIYVNPMDADVSITVAGVPATPRQEFALTATAAGFSDSSARVAAGRPRAAAPGGAAPPASLGSDVAYLNGAALIVGPDGLLPEFPIPGRAGGEVPFVAPPYSYGFVQFDGPVAACA